MQVIPPTLADHYNMHLGYWVFSVLLWIMFPWAKFADPGVIKPNKSAYDEAVKMVSSFVLHFVCLYSRVELRLCDSKFTDCSKVKIKLLLCVRASLRVVVSNTLYSADWESFLMG